MCGILGYIGNRELDSGKIRKILSLMYNRGPDHQAIRKFKFYKKNIYLFSSRLKIVDRLKRSNQPMSFENYTIIFNGEIYNHNDLKKIIISKGMKLSTNSDTEIILKMYALFKSNCVNYFEGMWSFAIYNSKTYEVFLSRDRMGEKPLFFFKKNNNIYFGSQTIYLRALADNYNSLNEKKIFSYLKYGFKSMEQEPQSFFKGIFKIDSGTNLLIDRNCNIKSEKFWKPSIKENNKLSETKCISLIKENFNKKIKEICSSELKIGLSLSGGIDSNFLLGFFAKNLGNNINTYSIIDEDKRYNEENLIDYASKFHNVKNKKIYLSPKKDYLERLKNLTKYHDKPISTISYFVQSLIYEKMNKDKIKICISGNGADELFAGYYHHYILYYNSLKKNVEKKNFLKQWNYYIFPILRRPEYKNLNKKNIESFFKFFNDDGLHQKNIKKFKEKFFTNNLLKNKMLNELLIQTMPLALLEDDLNSMYYSIENRSPFLNNKLINLAFKIPTNFLMKNSFNKYLLRMSAKNYIGDNLRLNREKKGFNASFYSLFSLKNKSLKDWFFDSGSPIFNYVKRQQFINTFKNNKFADLDQQRLFNFCSTKVFLENIKSQ